MARMNTRQVLEVAETLLKVKQLVLRLRQPAIMIVQTDPGFPSHWEGKLGSYIGCG